MTLCGPDIFLYGRITLLHPQFSAEIHTDFRAQPRGTCDPLAPSKLPFINKIMHLFKSHRAQSAFMQQSYFAAKPFDAKEKLLLSSTRMYLRNGADGICAGFSHLE